MSRALIVDGMSVMKTIAGPQAGFTNGFSYNFFSQLSSTIKKIGDVKGVFVVWEGGHEHRLKLLPSYKSERIGSSTNFQNQRRDVQNLLSMLNVQQAHAPGYEGDDCGAWMSHNLGTECVLYTNDNDWLQLVRPGITVWKKPPAITDPKKNHRREITVENFYEMTGWPTPELFLTGKCIQGDGVDGVPGIHGVGEGIAKNYLLGSEVSDKKRSDIEAFLASEEYARNRLLMDLRTPRLMEVVWRQPEPAPGVEIERVVTELGWKSIVKKFDEWHQVYLNAAL